MKTTNRITPDDRKRLIDAARQYITEHQESCTLPPTLSDHQGHLKFGVSKRRGRWNVFIVGDKGGDDRHGAFLVYSEPAPTRKYPNGHMN